MRWTLNRWTILAVILLLSTAVGLLFRPGGDGAEGQQVVEDESLTLTCPESVTAASGDDFTIECRAVDVGEAGEDNTVSASVSTRPLGTIADRGQDFKEVSPNEYALTAHVRAARNGRVDVQVNKYNYVLAEVAPGTVAAPFVPRNRQLVDSAKLGVNVRIQHHLLFYTGFGLSILLFISLVVIFIALLTHRRIGGGQLYTAEKRGRTAHSIASVLWPTYYALLVLLLLFHIVDTSAVDRIQMSIPAQIMFVVTIPLFLMSFVVLLVVRRLTFRKVTHSVSGQHTTSDDASDVATYGPSAAPIVGVVGAGFFFVPLAFLIQWLVYL